MVDIHTLLQHRDFVRALANRLVSDPDAAEDAEQDAWLAALKRPPSDESRVVPWLRSVVLNRVRSKHRADTRRVVRERAVAVSEAITSPADQARIADELGRAVHSLKAAHRDVIVLRFYEGLSSRETATRLGLPVETVRTRLKRGLSELRSRLDRVYDGDRRKWAMALSPWIGSSNPSGLVAWISGVLAMGVVWKTLVSSIAIAGVWVFFGRTPPPVVSLAAAQPTDIAAGDQGPARAQPAERSPMEPMSKALVDRHVPSGPYHPLRTNVLDMDTEEPIPFANARVTRVRGAVKEALGMIVADSGGQLDFRRELFSDGLGSVSALLADYSLRVGMAGYRSVVVVSNSGPTERWLPEEIFLERGGTVHGRLVDADGFAVPDGKTEFSLIGKTRVEVRDVEFRPNGAYSFISPVAGRYRLDVLHLCAGRGVSEELDLDPKRNQVVPDLVITGPAELVGRVVDLAWQPVAGLVVEAFSEDLSLEGVGTQHGEAVSAADGSFRFRGLAGERYEITTSEDMVEELVGITPGAVPVLLQINETRVSVEVLSAAGVPVPGSMVRAESFSPDEEVAWSEDWEVLRKDGRVDLLLPPGEYSIYAYSEGAVSARRAVFVREGQAVGTVPLSLQRIGVGGFVVWLSDYRGRGISILDVHVREIRGVEPEEWSVDGDGAKQVGVQGLSAGMYEVTIRPEATEWEGSVCQFQPTHTEVEILDGQVTEVRRVVREGGSVMIQINGIPPSPGGMGRWNPGVQWVPEGGDPIDLKYFLPGAIPAPGSPPPQFEIWSFDDVLPTGRGTLRIPTASGVRSVQASLYPSRTARITIPWAG